MKMHVRNKSWQHPFMQRSNVREKGRGAKGRAHSASARSISEQGAITKETEYCWGFQVMDTVYCEGH